MWWRRMLWDAVGMHKAAPRCSGAANTLDDLHVQHDVERLRLRAGHFDLLRGWLGLHLHLDVIGASWQGDVVQALGVGQVADVLHNFGGIVNRHHVDADRDLLGGRAVGQRDAPSDRAVGVGVDDGASRQRRAGVGGGRAGGGRIDRYGRLEIRRVSMVDVAALRRDLDGLAQQRRQIGTTIQATN